MSEGFPKLPITRRTFLVGAATSAATLPGGARAAEAFTDLHVETKYEKNKLVLVQLRLSQEEKQNSSANPTLTFRPETFAPLGLPGDDRLELRLDGLSVVDRNQGEAVAADTELTITVLGADHFLHRDLGGDGRRLFHQFIVFNDPIRSADGTSKNLWRIRLLTNTWVHRSRRTALEFPASPFDGERVSPLYDVMKGEKGFSLIIGPGWVSETFSRISGGPLGTSKRFVASLYAEGFSTALSLQRQIDKQTEWFWQVRPLNEGLGQMTLADQAIRFQSLQFGWKRGKIIEDQQKAADSYFEILSDRGGAVRGPRALVGLEPRKRWDGEADFSAQRFETPSDLETTLTVSALRGQNENPPRPTVRLRFNTVRKTSELDQPERRSVTIDLESEWRLSVQSREQLLADLNLNTTLLQKNPGPAQALDDEATATTPSLKLLRLPPNRGWVLEFHADNDEARPLPLYEEYGVEVDGPEQLPKTSLKVLPPTSANRVPQLSTVSFGPIHFQAGVSVRTQLTNGQVRMFRLQGTTTGLPVQLRDAEVFSKAEAHGEGPRPYLLLQDVLSGIYDPRGDADKNPTDPNRLSLRSAGHIIADIPRDRLATVAAARPGLDVPLGNVNLRVSRPRDFLSLNFRFSNMRLSATGENAELELSSDIFRENRSATSIDSSMRPVIRAEFAAQHMAEEAYFRQENFAKGLPRVNFFDLVEYLPIEERAAEIASLHGHFNTLRKGDRQSKIEARKALRKHAEAILLIIADLPEKSTKHLSDEKSIRALLEFNSKLVNQAAKENYAPTGRLPDDQLIYVGPEDLDPDVAKTAWDIVIPELLTETANRLINRLLNVEADVEFESLKAAIDNLPPISISNVNGIDKLSIEIEKFTVDPETKVGAAISNDLDELPNGFANPAVQSFALQQKYAELKDEVASDYAAFREFWRSHIFRQEGLPKDTLDNFSEFHAVRETINHPRARQLFVDAVFLYSDPAGGALEPFKERTRARCSGPSRLAFEWDPPGQPGVQGPKVFKLDTLLDWTDRTAAVPRRAEVKHKREPDGTLVRETNIAEILHHQGIGRDEHGQSTSATRMAEIWSASSTPPHDFETSIELPFRLNLSPAQDAIWVLPRPVEPEIYEDAPETEDFNELEEAPLWTASLSSVQPNPLLRAVWSDDFRPETYLARAAVDGISGDNDPLARLYEPPPRGPLAPWSLPRVRRRNGEIEEAVIVEETGPESNGPDLFRASLDARDRDELVKITSVPGQPVMGKIDPTTLEIRNDADAVVPPDGYELIDLRVDTVTNAEGKELEALDSHAIYRPKALRFSELRLSALGGTLDLDTSFEPAAPAQTRDRRPLFPAPTIKRWRHRAVLGRDIKVEVVYKGYLFPLGNHAVLVKVTERKYIQPPASSKRGPTAYLVQRFFIRVAQPDKTVWYDQPDGGRGWPVEKLTLLTRETPDIVDPDEPVPLPSDGEIKETANGRILFGPKRKGRVFWPRTAPIQTANVRFELQIDDVPDRMEMPLIFVDAEAARDPETIANLVEYYNGLDDQPRNEDDSDWVAKLSSTSRRTIRQGGTARRYGPEIEDGDSRYETLGWIIGAQGRPGRFVVPPGDFAGENDAFKQGKRVREERLKSLGSPRQNYDFGPLLTAGDQPPFYPFIQFTLLRLDRIARLTGGRRGQICIAAFDKAFLLRGLPDPNPEKLSGAQGNRPEIEAILDILSVISLDVGRKGDRIGAIGRPSGFLAVLARKEGPVTSRSRLTVNSGEVYGVPAFGQVLSPANSTGDEASLLVPGVGRINNIRFVQAPTSVSTVLEQILGDNNAKILGVFKITELLDVLLATLADNVPQISESLDQAGQNLTELVQFLRGTVLPELLEGIETVEETFLSAALDLGIERLEIRRVYPGVASGLTRLRVAVENVAKEDNDAKAASLSMAIPTAGKALLVAIDQVAHDPISPLKLELRNLFLDELRQIEDLRSMVERLSELTINFDEFLTEQNIEKVVLDEISSAIVQNREIIVVEIQKLLPFSSRSGADAIDEKFDRITEEIITILLEQVIDEAFETKVSFDEVFEAIQELDLRILLLNSIEQSSALAQIAADFEDEAANLEGEALQYWEALVELQIAAIRLAELKQGASTVLAAQVAIELARLQNEAIKTVFGITPEAFSARITNTKINFNKIQTETSIEGKIVAIVDTFAEIDALFVAGSFSTEITNTLGNLVDEDGVLSVTRPILNAYSCVLATASSMAGVTQPVVPITDPAYLKTTAEPIAEFESLLKETESTVEDINEALQLVDAALAQGQSDLRREIGFSPLRRFLLGDGSVIGGFLAAERRFVGEFLALGLETEDELAQIRDAAENMRIIAGTLFADFARQQARANRAYQSFLDAKQTAQNAIDTAEANPSIETYEALVVTFPKTELLAMLRAWPELIEGMFAALERAANAYKVTFDQLSLDDFQNAQAKINELLNDAAPAKVQSLVNLRRALIDLAGEVEANLAGLAQSLIEMVLIEIDRLPNIAAQADDEITKARIEVLELVSAAAAELNSLAANYSILHPIAEEFSALRVELSEIKQPETIRTRLGEISSALKAFETARGGSLEDRFEAVDAIKKALRFDAKNAVKSLLDEIKDTAGSAAENVRDVVIADAAHTLASLQTSLDSQVGQAIDFVVGTVFQAGRLDAGEAFFDALAKTRFTILSTMTSETESFLNQALEFLGIPLAPGSQPIDARHLFVAVSDPDLPLENVYSQKVGFLKVSQTQPADLLAEEQSWISTLNSDDPGSEKTRALRTIVARWSADASTISLFQIVESIDTTLNQIIRSDISTLIDLGNVRQLIETQIRKIVPTRLTTTMRFNAPIRGFGGIFEPTPGEPGSFGVVSKTTIDVGDAIFGDGSSNLPVEANAEAILSPFKIKLLGGFDAITLYFSEARMGWQLGRDPTFSIDFVRYEIGKELEFVQELAKSLSASSGGAYVKPATSVLGIEAGYRLNIAAINLGGVTFMNIGLSALAILPFENRKALFGAALSSRDDPFVIIAGIWGGGGHFQLTSDGRRITGFDASFVFGGGGAIAYGPLTLEGRVTVGVFIRKMGSFTEMSGDFFAGGSGRVAIFGISASLLVTMGMDGSGSMTGSAVFTFSFSVGIAKVEFSITLFKKEGKGFSSAGAEQSASLWGPNPVRYASLNGPDKPSSTAAIRVNTRRQDQDYQVWKSYFASHRARSYAIDPSKR